MAKVSFSAIKEQWEEEIREKNKQELILSDEVVKTISFESGRIYEVLSRISSRLENLKIDEFGDQENDYVIFLNKTIEDIDGVDSSWVTYLYEDVYKRYVIDFRINSIYLTNSPVSYVDYHFTLGLLDNGVFNPVSFINDFLYKTIHMEEHDIFNSIERNIKKYGHQNIGDIYSLLFSKHINMIIDSYNNIGVYPFLGESPIKELVEQYTDILIEGNELGVTRSTDNFYGNNTLSVTYSGNHIGYLPNDFGEFLCPGIVSGYTKVRAKVTRIEHFDHNIFVDVDDADYDRETTGVFVKVIVEDDKLLN